jgi:D-arginine dehydrogenase
MTHDIAIVGAGIAGATLAAAIGARARVLLLEAEDTPGYHASGRSAAFWSETYGGPGIQPLTSASHAGLADFLQPLGAVHIGTAADAGAADALLAAFAGSGVRLEQVDPRALVAGLRDDWRVGVAEPTCAYIDTAAYLSRALGEARRAGATLVTRAALTGAVREGGRWRLETRGGTFAADVLVDAAGAWADAVAALAGARAIGIQPYRRTMAQVVTDPAPAPRTPFVVHLRGDFYFKPEAGGRVWLSPHDETPVVAHDVAPEEEDVALAIDRFERAVDWRVARVERRWAGLRAFAPDRLPVYGWARDVPGFFWFAGQGGFGFQTADAAARIGAALLLGGDAPAGLDPARYAPGRFS